MANGIRKRPQQTRLPWQASAYASTGKRIFRSFATVAEARRWRADMERGTAPAAAATTAPTLVEAADDLITGMLEGRIRARGGGQFRASVAREYRRALDGRVLPKLGQRRITSITHRDLLDLVDDLHAAGLAPSTIRNLLDPVRVIMRRAVARGLVAANPTTGLELPSGDRKPRDRVAAPLEAAALVAALTDTRDRALFATALYAGLRAGELRALRWEHIDIAASRITVEASMDDRRVVTAPKTVKGRRGVPITPLLRKHLVALRAERDGAGYVFGEAPDVPFAPTTVYRRARADWKTADLDSITLHECRHSCISTWIAAGINLKVASAMAGHASISITLDRYGHVLPGGEDEAMAIVAAYMER